MVILWGLEVGGWLKNWQEIFIFLYFSGFEIESIYISGAAATAAACGRE